MNKKVPQKVAIVGGGILGTSLAYLLAKKEFQVSIIEKAPNLGGLASGFNFSSGSLERYYHHFFKSDTNLQQLLVELGLKDAIIWHQSKMGMYTNNKLYSFSQALDILNFPLLSVFDRLRLGLVSLYLQKKKPDKSYNSITALDWCNKYYGNKVTAIIWEPLLRSKFESYYDKVAMDWFHIRIHDRSSSRQFPWADEKLGYIRGGFQSLINKLEEKLHDLDVKVYKEAEITSYAPIKDKHLLKFKTHNELITQNFDIVISTIAPLGFIKIFNPPTKYARKLKELDFLGAYCFVVALKQPLSKFYWTSINDPKAPFVALVEHTNLLGKEGFADNSIVYLGKYTQKDSKLYKAAEEELWSSCFEYLKSIFPYLTKEMIIEKRLFKSPEAQHIVTKGFKVLSYETGRKGLFFSHFAQIHPHDRGTNYAIAQAYDLFNLITKKKWS